MWTAVRRWARTAPMPRVLIAGAVAWTLLTTAATALLSLVTGWSAGDPWYGDLLGRFCGGLLLSWVVAAGRRGMAPEAERAQRAMQQRRLPADGDPVRLRRALEIQRRSAVRIRRWVPPLLALGAGGLLWLAVVDGAAELWVAAACVATVAVLVRIVQGRRAHLAGTLLDGSERRGLEPPTPS